MLAELLPNIFEDFNRVTSGDEYQRHELRCGVFALLASIFATSYIAALFDNARYERVIDRTNGFYKIHKELPRYISDTWCEDLIASSVIQLPFLLFTLIQYPEHLKNLGRIISRYLAPHLAVTEVFGVILSYILITLTAFAARMISAPAALKRYRALWLTSFVED